MVVRFLIISAPLSIGLLKLPSISSGSQKTRDSPAQLEKSVIPLSPATRLGSPEAGSPVKLEKLNANNYNEY